MGDAPDIADTEPAPLLELFGIDISHWQDPELIDWQELSKLCSFIAIRATYGGIADRKVKEHVRCARRVAMQILLYHFFRIVVKPEVQLRAFRAVARSVSYGEHDVIPALDIEDDGKYRLVNPEWNAPLQQVANGLCKSYRNCLMYCSQRDWIRLGKPEWLLRHPQWPPHWNVSSPATPGDRPWRIWQCRVEPLPPAYNHPIDQDIGRAPLPLIRDPGVLNEITKRRVEGMVAVTLDESYRRRHRMP